MSSMLRFSLEKLSRCVLIMAFWFFGFSKENVPLAGDALMEVWRFWILPCDEIFMQWYVS